MKIVAPSRVTRSHTQRLIAAQEAVFPLPCPVGETDWIPGRDPWLMISTSGLAGADCVFVAPAAAGEAFGRVTLHAPRAGLNEMDPMARSQASATGSPPRGRPAEQIFMPA